MKVHLSRFGRNKMVGSQVIRIVWCKDCGAEVPKCIVCKKQITSLQDIRCDGRRHICNPCYHEQKEKKQAGD